MKNEQVLAAMQAESNAASTESNDEATKPEAAAPEAAAPETTKPEAAKSETKTDKPKATKPAAKSTKAKSTKAKSTKSKFAARTVKAIAEQSWWRRTSKKKLATEHSLTEEQIDELRATPEYQKAVEALMHGQRDTEAFTKWLKDYGFNGGKVGGRNMSTVFGGRMGVEPKVVPVMVKNVHAQHALVADGKAKAPKMINDPHKK